MNLHFSYHPNTICSIICVTFILALIKSLNINLIYYVVFTVIHVFFFFFGDAKDSKRSETFLNTDIAQSLTCHNHVHSVLGLKKILSLDKNLIIFIIKNFSMKNFPAKTKYQKNIQ